MFLNDFQYCVEYEYNTDYTCQESGCDDEGICRCGKIENAYVKSVNISHLVNDIYQNLVDKSSKSGKRDHKISELFYGGEIVDKYCIDRIVRKSELWNPEIWELKIIGGYYGEEIGGVGMPTSKFNLISKQCYDMLQLDSLSEKIKFILSMEYGYLLEDLKDSEFELIEINRSDIDFRKLNSNHIQKVKQKNLDFYSDDIYDLPRGVVKKSGHLFTIIDGYHRIITSKKPTYKVFCKI